MWKYAIGLGISGMVSAHILSSHLESTEQVGRTNEPAPVQHIAKSVSDPSPSTSYYGRKTSIAMDQRGHFVTNAKMNNRTVEVLVDTGATNVAINHRTAKRLGIHLKRSDFKYEVQTANGITKAAVTTIDRIQIGRVEVRDVTAAVLEDKALSSTLLGMSFLKKLKSFEVSNRQLVLTQ